MIVTALATIDRWSVCTSDQHDSYSTSRALTTELATTDRWSTWTGFIGIVLTTVEPSPEDGTVNFRIVAGNLDPRFTLDNPQIVQILIQAEKTRIVVRSSDWSFTLDNLWTVQGLIWPIQGLVVNTHFVQFLGAIWGLHSQSTDCLHKDQIRVLHRKSTNCLDLYFAHNIYRNIFVQLHIAVTFYPKRSCCILSKKEWVV